MRLAFCHPPAAPEEINADTGEISHDKGSGGIGMDVGEKIGTCYPANHAGDDQGREEFPVHIAVDGVADCRRSGCKKLYNMDR